ncbi:VOC family protein [Cellulomonas marina]|uniref:VOC family protein n=1 Tax=Cellulomonas marina TaxID=988821 RepID=UPI0019410928|nr:VOC family protein [Cellulomonas marina]GIG29659.1 hypothetical protein Cma02nite_22590 [Cellulomonas marina]
MTTTAPAVTASLTTAMFTVADQDAALAFYTRRLGWELRGDTRFGADGEGRWVEVAPAGSVARLALNRPWAAHPAGPPSASRWRTSSPSTPG